MFGAYPFGTGYFGDSPSVSASLFLLPDLSDTDLTFAGRINTLTGESPGNDLSAVFTGYSLTAQSPGNDLVAGFTGHALTYEGD